MKIPASPTFILFLRTISDQQRYLLLYNMNLFLDRIDGRKSAITLSEGLRTHPSLELIKSHIFIFERYNRIERWHIIFFDTVIPHAIIEMRNCTPPLKNSHSLDIDYTQLLIKQSLADVAIGFDYSPKTLLQQILTFPGGEFAIVGKTEWVYLMLKIKALPELYKRFKVELTPKLPCFEFANHLAKIVGHDNQQELIRVSYEKKSIKAFFEEKDALIIDVLGEEQMKKWLSSLGIKLDNWLKATF